MSGIKDRVSAALGKDTTHGTHGTTDINDGRTGQLHSGQTTSGVGTGGYGTGGAGTGGLTSGTGTGYTGTGTSTGYTGTGTSTGGLTSGTGVAGQGYDTSRSTLHGTGQLVGGSGQVIDSKVFTKTEDHEVLIEKKAYELEHRPVEKEYVVETRYVGESRVAGGPTELVGTEAREVEERVVEAPRGDRAVVVENVDVPVEVLQQQQQQQTTGMTGGQTYGTSGTGRSGTGLGGSNTSSF